MNDIYDYLFIKNLNKTWLKFSILTDEIITDKNGNKIDNKKLLKIILYKFKEKTLKSILLNYKLNDKLLFIFIRLYLKIYKSKLVDINYFSKHKFPKQMIIINNNYKKVYTNIPQKIKLENLLFLIQTRATKANNIFQ